MHKISNIEKLLKKSEKKNKIKSENRKSFKQNSEYRKITWKNTIIVYQVRKTEKELKNLNSSKVHRKIVQKLQEMLTNFR